METQVIQTDHGDVEIRIPTIRDRYALKRSLPDDVRAIELRQAEATEALWAHWRLKHPDSKEIDPLKLDEEGRRLNAHRIVLLGEVQAALVPIYVDRFVVKHPFGTGFLGDQTSAAALAVFNAAADKIQALIEFSAQESKNSESRFTSSSVEPPTPSSIDATTAGETPGTSE
jgi:hypothetical protein